MALAFLLESIAAMSGAKTIAIADGRDELVCGIGPGAVRLGYAARRCAAGDAPSNLETLVGAEDVYAHAIEVHGRPYYVASLGARVRKLRSTTEGLQRILG